MVTAGRTSPGRTVASSTKTPMAEGSPQRIVESGGADSLPPMLIMQGTADDNIPADSSRRFSAAYIAAGGRAEMQTYEGEPHTFITRNPSSINSQAALKEIVSFILERAGTKR